MKRRIMLSMAATLFAGGVLLTSQAYAAYSQPNFVHPLVYLLDANGNYLNASSTAPYSPKQTCIVGGCHGPLAAVHGVGNIYETNWELAAKTQWSRDGVEISYEVPYPANGISAGYHFQQGRNVEWGAVQQDFYHVPEFTSSSGMYGKY